MGSEILDTTEARNFLDGFKPTDLKTDPLPLKVYRGSITKDEAVGQAVYWALEYFHHQHRLCPPALKNFILWFIKEETTRKVVSPVTDFCIQPSKPECDVDHAVDPIEADWPVDSQWEMKNPVNKVDGVDLSLDPNEADWPVDSQWETQKNENNVDGGNQLVDLNEADWPVDSQWEMKNTVDKGENVDKPMAPNETEWPLDPLREMQNTVNKVDDILVKLKDVKNDKELKNQYPGYFPSRDCHDSASSSSPLLAHKISSHSMKNQRKSMEDKMVILPRMHEIFGLDNYISYFAVFDGHNGIEAAAYGAAQLHEILIKNLKSSVGMTESLLSAFKTTDAMFLEKANAERLRSGSTVAAVVIDGQKLYVAWAGDCQVSLNFGNGQTKQLVSSHKPEREDERQRIQSMGGEVLQVGDMFRVNGSLAVTRSIGDPDYKECVISVPEIVEMDGNQLEAEYLVLASDGLWDSMNASDVSLFVNNLILEDKGMEAAHELAMHAKSKGSQDNITIIVVYLQSMEKLTSLIKNRATESASLLGECLVPVATEPALTEVNGINPIPMEESHNIESTATQKLNAMEIEELLFSEPVLTQNFNGTEIADLQISEPTVILDVNGAGTIEVMGPSLIEDINGTGPTTSEEAHAKGPSETLEVTGMILAETVEVTGARPAETVVVNVIGPTATDKLKATGSRTVGPTVKSKAPAGAKPAGRPATAITSPSARVGTATGKVNGTRSTAPLPKATGTRTAAPGVKSPGTVGAKPVGATASRPATGINSVSTRVGNATNAAGKVNGTRSTAPTLPKPTGTRTVAPGVKSPGAVGTKPAGPTASRPATAAPASFRVGPGPTTAKMNGARSTVPTLPKAAGSRTATAGARTAGTAGTKPTGATTSRPPVPPATGVASARVAPATRKVNGTGPSVPGKVNGTGPTATTQSKTTGTRTVPPGGAKSPGKVGAKPNGPSGSRPATAGGPKLLTNKTRPPGAPNSTTTAAVKKVATSTLKSESIPPVDVEKPADTAGTTAE